ncbi:hypothetical protein [Rhodoligotrophos defluvii]|uniref:hypothetical protein n=1 Tax=Rhodoligotrophos defluvii TaxID=2561934 RepID=UPI0010C9D7BF|nr:hypothetical protein [Rhodoligotrophos defluvii]
MAGLAIRWTIGDVSRRGFEALRFSIFGATKVYGALARYSVCVNTLSIAEAKRRTGPVPDDVEWRQVQFDDIPDFIRWQLDRGMAEGVAWKFAPLRLYPERHELALDNDCILWREPSALRAWRQAEDASTTILAEDVRPAFGQFSRFCHAPRNSGVRGLPPGLDYGRLLRALLARSGVVLRSELDEQGLQAAALMTFTRCLHVSLADVSLCSPFSPNTTGFGENGAHFIGINVKQIPWHYYGRPADDWIDEHWRRCRPALSRLVGMAPPDETRMAPLARHSATGA